MSPDLMQLPPIYRGVQLAPLTNSLVQEAYKYERRFHFADALDVHDQRDKDGVILFVAQHITRRTIRAVHHANIGEDIDSLLERTDNNLIEIQKRYIGEYPEGSNRPYHIQRGINTIFSQLDRTPIRGPFFRRTRERKAAYDHATTWREMIARDRAKQRTPQPVG